MESILMHPTVSRALQNPADYADYPGVRFLVGARRQSSQRAQAVQNAREDVVATGHTDSSARPSHRSTRTAALRMIVIAALKHGLPDDLASACNKWLADNQVA